ncbi:MAG TPA: hypothetical protein VLK29_10945 [Luteimonas sp.]|nr:hypothetical protein [Luteimonas sp.]
MRHGVRRWLLACALGPALLTAAAATEPATPGLDEPQGVAEVLTNQLGPLTRARSRGALEPAKVYFRGKSVRIEFADRDGKAFAMLLPETGQVGWLMDDASAMPLPNSGLPVVFDGEAPCGSGMLAQCARTGTGQQAGRDAVHWRYRLPNPTGPGRTSRGTMWLDAETGVVLAYEGEAGVGPARQWRTLSVDYQPVPDSMFEVPEDRLRAEPTLRR